MALANEAAAEGPNMNEAVKGGTSRLLPAGYAFARLVEVVELGNHAQDFQGQKKDPAPEIQLGFALYNTADRVYQNEDGTPYIVRPWSMALSRNEKARAFLLFKSLNWKGTAKNFGQLLGQTFLVKIVHKDKKVNGVVQGKKSEIDLKGFLPPLDPVSKQPYPIAEVPESMYKLFLWSRPTLEGFNSLKIDGTFEVEEGGQRVQKSKNRVQETILGALDFQGSQLQLLLGGAQGLGKAPASPVVAAPTVVAPQVAPVAAPVAVAPVAVPPVVAVAAPVLPVFPA